MLQLKSVLYLTFTRVLALNGAGTYYSRSENRGGIGTNGNSRLVKHYKLSMYCDKTEVKYNIPVYDSPNNSFIVVTWGGIKLSIHHPHKHSFRKLETHQFDVDPVIRASLFITFLHCTSPCKRRVNVTRKPIGVPRKTPIPTPPLPSIQRLSRGHLSRKTPF